MIDANRELIVTANAQGTSISNRIVNSSTGTVPNT